ncbi:energy transducer TonB [uncultured Ruegeria sp.]|uniref:energy transducer TonB family protein n=1 Tax=uncultured Ruegeria sp. TaxID=259304 RepID=UPI002631AB5B|nr:TonB family protein [uncultured Ruegeria sp.]
MIRRSLAVATIALLVSLLVHGFGLSVVVPDPTARPAADSTVDTVALGNAFEDLADAPAEPVQPEPAKVPDPPVETAPEPEPAEVLASEARVASEDPQQVPSPDTGTAEILQPTAAEPPQPDAPEGEDPPEDGADTTEETAATPPVEPDTATETPVGPADGSAAPVEAETAVAPSIEPTATIAPVPEATAVPVVPLEQAAIVPEIPLETAEPVPDEPDAAASDEETDATDLAVATSPRPHLREERPTPTLKGLRDGLNDFSDLRNPTQLVESPLRIYQRDGVDAFRQRNSGSRSGGRGPGNADTTNYAGDVLVHLNRSPVVYVKDRGFAQVFFEINPDGTLAWVDVVNSSGSQNVNRAAKAQVKSAAPFPRPPGGISRKLSFFYQIN